MASLLTNHLEQISLCATSIADLDFPGPRRFTNAILANHDITSLIRDTEQHERALFHLAPPAIHPPSAGTGDLLGYAGAGNASHLAPSFASTATANRRATVHAQRQPRNKAVAAVLGGDMYRRTRANEGMERAKGEVDVELLLAGAEKLAAVYPIAGAAEKIVQLRRRHHQLSANVAHYEAHVAQQARELQSLNRATGQAYSEDFPVDLDEDDETSHREDDTITIPLTRSDLEREEAEILELERKKKSLEERVTGMERDLGGLMR